MITREQVERRAPMIAFVFLALVIGLVIRQSSVQDAELLREALIVSCERVNEREEAANRRAKVLVEILQDIATQREAEALSIPDSEEAVEQRTRIAARYRALADDLVFVESSVDCRVDITNPQ